MNHDLVAVGKSGLGNKVLERLACAALLGQQAIDIDLARLVGEVEVAILVAALDAGGNARELIPDGSADGGGIELGNGDRRHVAGGRAGEGIGRHALLHGEVLQFPRGLFYC